MYRQTKISVVLFVALFCSMADLAQETDLWPQVGSFNPLPPKLKNFIPNHAQLVNVKQALRARVKRDGWPCAEVAETGWTENLRFEELPVSGNDTVVLVEAGMGCARGGSGANGAMWVVDFHGDRFSFIATPQSGFNGWLYSVQRTTSQGFRDLVLGWRVSAREGGLAYFRFNGKSYQLIGEATYLTDEEGKGKIIPRATDGVHR
jgi:hypothetical protein